MCALVVNDLVGGLSAVPAEVNTWAEARWTEALLAAPVPIIVVLVVTAVVGVLAARRVVEILR